MLEQHAAWPDVETTRIMGIDLEIIGATYSWQRSINRLKFTQRKLVSPVPRP